MGSDSTVKQPPSPYRECRRVIVALALIATLTGVFETATIIVIVAFIEGVTSGDLRWEVTTGPLDLALDRGDLLVIAFMSLVGMTIGQLLAAWMKARAVSGWQLRTQMRAISAFLRADWSAQSGETSGSLQNLVSLSWGSAEGLRAVVDLLSAAGAVSIFVIAAFVASSLAAAALLVTGVFLMLGLRPIRSAARQATRSATLAQRAVTEDVGEVHLLAQEIRVHNATEAVEESLRKKSNALRNARLRASTLSSTGSVLYRSLGLAFVLVAAIVASSQSELDVARIGVAGLLLLRSLGYGQRIQKAWQQIQNAQPYHEQVEDAIAGYERSRPPRGIRLADEIVPFALEDVSYSYDGLSDALSGVTMTLEPGETLGVVGPSGGGKSTLAQILLGLRQPTHGSFTTRSGPAIDIAADEWYKRVAVVPQQPQLLRGSVLENIVFHRSHVTEDAAIEAAKASGLHGEITALPEGYYTVIGDAERNLSGGQRQRLGIARALAGQPELLILDEPTSALDAVSEAHVQDTLRMLKGRLTVVIIAHRLATLNSCDRLVVLSDGKVLALDTPEQVMEQSDFYRTAVEMQLVGAVEESSSLGDTSRAGSVG